MPQRISIFGEVDPLFGRYPTCDSLNVRWPFNSGIFDVPILYVAYRRPIESSISIVESIFQVRAHVREPLYRESLKDS